ncbi:MAG TPA: hypothetical protein DCZ95_14515 [Verrucomicrobia bacterium]|nr:MAG: hypothetical protein A2X46_07065 [Lentisphaerae bacterium GWF2_57_35]HBA85297.1 hypothetical protein [Verrucomicrobiota bacterium]
MQIRKSIAAVSVLLLAASFLFAGCEGGGSEDATVNVSGSWSGTTTGGTMSMVLVQTGNSASGSITWNGTYISGTATFEGEVHGNELTGTYVRPNGMTGSIAVTVTENSISGEWTQSNGLHGSIHISKG